MRVAAIRCCGRFAFWRLYTGPWECTVCHREIPGPMPKNAIRRFWDWIEETEARLASRPPPPNALELDAGEFQRMIESTVDIGRYLARAFP